MPLPPLPRLGLRLRLIALQFSWHLIRYVAVWSLLVVAVPALLLGWTPVTIVGGSMEPSIRIGDVLLTDPDVAPDVGDVATYDEVRRGLITHRVRGWTADGDLVLKGDANQLEDVPVDPDRVEGVGRLLIPGLALPLMWLDGWVARIGAVVLLAALLARTRGRLTTRARQAVVTGAPLALVAVAVLVTGTTDAAFTGGHENAGSSFQVQSVPPATNLTATCQALPTTRAVLTWTATTSPVATSQSVEVLYEGAGTWTSLQAGLPMTQQTYEHMRNLENPATRSYRVVTHGAGPFRTDSATTTITMHPGCTPPPPTPPSP